MNLKISSQTAILVLILGLTSYSPTAQAQTADVLNSQIADPLKPGDRLRVTVVGFTDFSGEQMIATDGTIQMPSAGAIQIGGLTPAEAAERITESLRPYIRRPQVGIAIVNLSSIRINVSGEVVQPGPRVISPYDAEASETNSSSVIPLTLTTALVQAGGITPDADIQNIVIRRCANPAFSVLTTCENSRIEINVDLWQAIKNGDLAFDPKIYNGDEIIVPIIQSGVLDQQALMSSTIAPTTITIQIAGEVANPGLIEIAPGADVSAAVAAAGGRTDEADNDIALLRMSAEGRLEERDFNFGEVSPVLRDGDIIFVDKKSTNRFLDFLGDLLNPISTIFSILGN